MKIKSQKYILSTETSIVYKLIKSNYRTKQKLIPNDDQNFNSENNFLINKNALMSDGSPWKSKNKLEKKINDK